MIAVFLGQQNEGKTLSIVYYGYLYYLKGYEIFSNFNLSYPHKKITKQILEDYTKSRHQFQKTVFLIDEIYLFFDSRSSGTKQNKIFSYFITQTSKNNVHIFCTAQNFNTVEKRLRNNTAFKCFCSRVIKENDSFFSLNSRIRMLNNRKNQKLYIKNIFLIREISGFMEKVRKKTFYLKADKIYKLYDTRELIAID